MTGHAMHQAQATALARDATVEGLATVFNGGGRTGHSDELRTMIVHELVLAGHNVLDHPAVGHWARLGQWRHDDAP
jgi:hypothetical protein